MASNLMKFPADLEPGDRWFPSATATSSVTVVRADLMLGGTVRVWYRGKDQVLRQHTVPNERMRAYRFIGTDESVVDSFA